MMYFRIWDFDFIMFNEAAQQHEDLISGRQGGVFWSSFWSSFWKYMGLEVIRKKKF